jgi:hypothetical protein
LSPEALTKRLAARFGQSRPSRSHDGSAVIHIDRLTPTGAGTKGTALHQRNFASAQQTLTLAMAAFKASSQKGKVGIREYRRTL